MMNNIRITVITVAYNALEALQRTMHSVDIQEYDNIEYIVVDGGSADGTVEMLRTYKGRLTTWISEADSGIYYAMNKGVTLATGDYCIFMNAGDTFVDKTTVRRTVELKIMADVVYGDIMKNGKRIVAGSPRNCHKMFYCHQSAFVKTKCLEEFPFDINHRMSADFKQAKQMILANKSFKHIDVVVADFDTTGVSNTNRSRGLWDNIMVIWEVDSVKDKCRLLPRIVFTYLLCKLRGK